MTLSAQKLRSDAAVRAKLKVMPNPSAVDSVFNDAFLVVYVESNVTTCFFVF
jgi:hypothetical protein